MLLLVFNSCYNTSASESTKANFSQVLITAKPPTAGCIFVAKATMSSTRR